MDKEKRGFKSYYIEEDSVHIYTDASYNQSIKTGTYGCCIISKEGYHYLYGEFKDVSCITDCEIKAVMNALDYYQKMMRSNFEHKKVKVYTDSASTISHLSSAKEDVEDINSKFFYVKKFYVDKVNEMDIDISFFKVRAHQENHSAITLVNDFCDRMSKAYMSISILERSKPQLKIHSNKAYAFVIFDKIESNDEDWKDFLVGNYTNIKMPFRKVWVEKLSRRIKDNGLSFDFGLLIEQESDDEIIEYLTKLKV